MGEEQKNHVESDKSSVAAMAADHPHRETSSEKGLVPFKESILDAKKVADDHGDEKKRVVDSEDRDSALAKVELEKRWALIKAWEESEKTKADNKAYKKLSAVEAWENTKKAAIDAELKQIEEEFEKKKAQWGEKMKNKIAELHRAAEEKRALVEAKKAEEILKIDEVASKCRATGSIPKRLFSCFT